MNLKIANMLCFKIDANRYGIGLSNEILFIIIAQGAVKEICHTLALLLGKNVHICQYSFVKNYLTINKCIQWGEIIQIPGFKRLHV